MILRRLLESAVPGGRVERLRAGANAHFDAGRYGEAAADYERLLALRDDPRARVNLGYCHLAAGAANRAEDCFRAALAHAVTEPSAHTGLGDAAAARGDHAEAVACYRRAVAANPGLAVAHNNLALSLTALGELEEAYREAEWRYALPDTRALFPHHVALARWRGEPLAGGRLLVHWEQGFGDIIQHLRFLPLLRGRGVRFVFDCPPPLLPLARSVVRPEESRAAEADGVDVAGFDRAVPLLSLPHALGITWATLPRPPYVFADAGRAAALRAAWRTDERRLVGIAWRSSAFDPARDVSLGELLSVLDGRAERGVALQVGISGEERATLAVHGAVEGLAAASDFGETAAAVAAVDRVICVDTVIAHLAGAMDRPAWVLLNEPAAVRWMLGREDSPWYGSVRLFRRRRGTPVASVVESLRAALAPTR